jgi:hypothetical protein
MEVDESEAWIKVSDGHTLCISFLDELDKLLSSAQDLFKDAEQTKVTMLVCVCVCVWCGVWCGVWCVYVLEPTTVPAYTTCILHMHLHTYSHTCAGSKPASGCRRRAVSSQGG